MVGSENEFGPCRDSIEAISKRGSDAGPFFNRATKGYEARQMHLNKWYEEDKYPFILFLDHDMIFPPHVLDKLRAHQKPFVSGFYMRRTIRPTVPVWFEQGRPGEMPMKPLISIPEINKLYPIGASGWGCLLIHRDVITAMKPLLKGELEIIEDDMDIHPYDTQAVLSTLRELDEVTRAEKNINTDFHIRECVERLNSEIRPLRGIKNEIVGSDIRFPFFARLAGFDLWGDTGVLCQHITSYPVSLEDWLNQSAVYVRDISLGVNDEDRKERDKIRQAIS